MRAYVQRLLSPYWEVEAVADGAKALAVASERLPDLVLADVMMPGLDGFALLRALRADPRTATIPVLLLSARAGEEARVEGLEAGADDYLVKPFSARTARPRRGAPHPGTACAVRRPNRCATLPRNSPPWCTILPQPSGSPTMPSATGSLATPPPPPCSV